jgi:hypothetical protein
MYASDCDNETTATVHTSNPIACINAGRRERIEKTENRLVIGRQRHGDVHEATIAHRGPLRVFTVAITADLVVWT